MNYKDIVLEITKDNSKRGIHLFLPNNYDCKMDGTVLMVGETGTTLRIAGYYLFLYRRYEDINENNYSTILARSNLQTENYGYKKEYISNCEFKTYCIRYKDDYTVNKVYIYKINDEIVGQVELQYFGAKSDNAYSFNEINPFLSMLVNAKAENAVTLNNNMNNQYNNGNSVNPDEVINIITKNSSTMNWMIKISVGIIILGVLVDILYTKFVMMTIITLICAAFFMTIYGVKLYLGKRNLKGIDFNEIKNELVNNCISFPKMKTYFTNNYIISNYYHPFIIKYSDIIWMHPVDKNYNGAYLGTDLIMYTKDKRKAGFIFSEDIVNIILNHNSEILYGYTPENRKKYKEIIKNIKNS